VRRFLERALAKAWRMDAGQLRDLLVSVASENSLLEAVLESTLDGIVVCDPDDVPLLFNKAAERLLPLALEGAFDRPLWESVTDDDLADFLEEVLRSDGKELDRAFAVDSKGASRIVSVSVTPLVRERSVQGTLVHVEDVTDKKREEARLRRAESLASLTTLAAGVAHEIKNPLGAVGIHLQLARKALAAEAKGHGCEIDGKVTRHLDVVEEELDRLNRIVLDFLFAVRPMDVAPEEDDLDKVVREAAELVRPEAEGAGVRLELSLSLSLPRVRIDRRYVRQAILNLAKNAIAATPEGGVLRFATARTDEAVALEISDTGAGIAEENLGKIFEPYYTTKSDGTGLGLTITYKIMKEHGGDIQVRSRPGQGTTFTLVFPLPRTERRLLEYDAELRAEAEGRE